MNGGLLDLAPVGTKVLVACERAACRATILRRRNGARGGLPLLRAARGRASRSGGVREESARWARGSLRYRQGRGSGATSRAARARTGIGFCFRSKRERCAY